LEVKVWPYYIILFLIGFFLGGPYNVICSASAVDIAQSPVLKGKKRALSTIASLINGFGSFGAALM
jgi:sugar phosphate permease